MNSNSNSRLWKRKVVAAVGLLCLLDLGLVAFRWHLEKTPETQLRAQEKILERAAKLLDDDVQSAAAIRQHMAGVGQQAERFYREELLPASTGYSSIEADLSQIAGKAGARTSNTLFKQKDLKERGVTQVDITTEVQGDYTQLLRLIDGLERSRNFYMLNHLALGSSTTGGVKLNLELTTYFRT